MNDNLDDWLNSLGSETSETPSNQPAVQHTEAPSPEPQNLSDQDFDDILGDFGFSRPEDIEAEEIIEEEPDHPNLTVADNENGESIRDLDAEEDADWQEAIDSGRVVPLDDGLPEQTRQVLQQYEEEEAVHFHMPDGDVVDVPIISENSASEEPLLPLNSPTLLLDESTTRFSGAEWYHEIQKQSIILAGCGGIGSWVALQLARLHPLKMVMYDDDTVEAVNMAGQLYARNDIGMPKVNAISNKITAYTNMQNVYALQQRFEASTEAGNVMMCGFDNMEARKTFFLKWQEHVGALPEEERKKCLYLDGIMKCLSDSL